MNELNWGETPWDKMTREELLREVQRMYAAVNAADSVLNLMRIDENGNRREDGFWGKGGTAGRAHEMTRQIAEPLWNEYDREQMYDGFFRYANDLLFDRSTGYRIGFGWAVCPVCGDMYGETGDGRSSIGRPCNEHLREDCPGVLRPLTWDDMQPEGRERPE